MSLRRWRSWRQRYKEEQLEKELRFHLDRHISDLMARGRDPETARREARLALGGPEQVKEQCRDERRTRWLEDAWQDFRYAMRSLVHQPGFAAVILCTLALSIGATTVMFTVVNGVLLKPLPYAEPGRLVRVHGATATWNVAVYGEQNLAYFDFLDSQAQSRSLDIAGWVYNGGTVSAPEPAEYVDEFDASPDLFSVLGVPLFRGRAFLPEENHPGAARVAILGYSFWQRRFAGNASVLGSALVFDGKSYTVIGIAAPNFRLGGDEADLYAPIGQNTAAFMRDRGPHPVTVIARLRDGATLPQAQAELALIGRRLANEYPATNRGRGFDVEALRPDIGNVRYTLWLLLGAVSLVLLIACVNVANLLLARAVSRERELAVRVALGAGRGRLVRQAFTESAILGLCGGVLGLGIAAVGIRPFVVFWPGSLPRAEEVRLDWHVLLFVLAVSLVSGLLFGLAPALRAPAREVEQTLRAGVKTVAGTPRRVHGGFVISEIALAVVLLVSAGMLGHTLLYLSALDPGFNIRSVLITRMALSPGTLANPGRIRAAWDDVLERAGHVPGVEAIAMVDTVPMRQGYNELGYWPSAAVPPANQQPVALATSVTPDYLRVMGIPLRAGRFFDAHDRMGSENVVVIDDVLVRSAFSGQNPVGKRLWVPDMGPGPFKVVGVVGHVRHWGLAADDHARVRAQLYYPFAQVPDGLLRRWSELMSIAVRTNIAPLNVVEPLRRQVRGASGDQVLYEVNTLEQLARASLARQRFLLLLFGLFASVAVLLACIGIYGVLAYLTSQRVPEMGLRMALGASARDVLQLVLKQSLRMILFGVAAGTLAAFAAGRVLEGLVEGMRPNELASLGLTVPLLIGAALLASFVPARRASRIDPMKALRQE